MTRSCKMKWVKVKNKKEWACDVCGICGDHECCAAPAKWLKHPNVYARRERGLRIGSVVGDISLCDRCFDGHHERILKEIGRTNENIKS